MNLSTKHSIRTTPKLGFTGLQVPITIRGEKYELLDQVSCCLAQLLKGKYREISDAAAAVAIVRGFPKPFFLVGDGSLFRNSIFLSLQPGQIGQIG